MTVKWNTRNHITKGEMAKTSPSKIVIDLTKCNKRACIFERTKKQNKVDPLNGLVGNHPYFRNYTQ